MKTLAIETSCDDTSLAVVQEHDGYFSVEKMCTTSQTALHDTYGGVVPELAYRAHAEHILGLVEELGGNTLMDTIDVISVTARPGLPGALLVGITTAYTLGRLWGKPVQEVNHIMGHVFSILLERSLDMTQVPYVCLTVSGGHSDIYVVVDKETSVSLPAFEEDANRIKRQHLGVGEELFVGDFRVVKVGQTRDDAAGEAFDKVARMLGGPYPGGAWLSRLAEAGGPDERVVFRAPSVSGTGFDMSFSGLKSQVYNLIQACERTSLPLDKTLQANIAFVFQKTITTMISKKLIAAAATYNAKAIGVVGGVAANEVLIHEVGEARDIQREHPTVRPGIFTPQKRVYCTDNAAMIGVVGCMMHKETLKA